MVTGVTGETDDRFIRARGVQPLPGGEAWWFVFAGPRVLLREDAEDKSAPLAATPRALGLEVADPLYIGDLDGTPCVAAQLVADAIPDGYAGYDLRRLYGAVPEEMWSTAALAYQLLYWAATARFCSRTGHAARYKDGEWATECPECGFTQYPRVSPCTITLIHDDQDGGRLLMTRQPGWPAGRYGLVAGFVEPGETLEHCVEREIREETGIVVTDITYSGSQSWPFPHQLMVGFSARYAGGEVVVDRSELEDASWFSLDALPTLPPPLSIARRLIDRRLAAHGRTPSGDDRGWG